MATETAGQTFDWQDIVAQTYQQLFQQSQQFLPELLTSLLVVFSGLITAFALRFITHRLIHGFDRLFKWVARTGNGDGQQLKNRYASLISRIVFWLVLTLFITAAVDVLGWSLLTTWLQDIIAYLPRLIVAIFIITLAIMSGGWVQNLVSQTLKAAGVVNADFIGRLAQLLLLTIAMVVGLQQLGLDITFLTTWLIVISAVVLLGIALAFALGARTYVANLIAMQVVRSQYQLGDQLLVDNAEGTIIELSATTLILDGPEGRICIPAKILQQRISQIAVEQQVSKKGADHE